MAIPISSPKRLCRPGSVAVAFSASTGCDTSAPFRCCAECLSQGVPVYAAEDEHFYCWGCWVQWFSFEPADLSKLSPKDHSRWSRLLSQLEVRGVATDNGLIEAPPALAELAALARRSLAIAPRLEPGDPEVRRHVRAEGYAVIAGVLDDTAVTHAEGLFWEMLEASTEGAVCRGDMATWEDAWPASSVGLIRCPGVGQSDFMWYLRTQPRVLQAFSGIWGCKPSDLISSFDACNAYRPLKSHAHWRTRGVWYHVDQNARETGSNFECVQGLIALTDCNSDTGGLVVCPRSHLRHEELSSRVFADPGEWTDFVLVPWHDAIICENAPILVQCKRGDLIVWDSRTVHCNSPAPHPFETFPLAEALDAEGLGHVADQVCTQWDLWSVQDAILRLTRGRDLGPIAGHVSRWAERLVASSPALPDGARLQRLVAYVCFMPRDRASPEVLAERQRRACLGHTMSHWPCKVQTVLEDAGPYADKDFTELERRLIGYPLAGFRSASPILGSSWLGDAEVVD